MDNTQEVESPVVPDSIEPVVGWKGMTLLPDGYLMSPSYNHVWQPMQPFKAVCHNDAGNWAWEACGPHDERAYIVDVESGGWEQTRPKTILPSGMEWRVVHTPWIHDIADEHCSCGVYIAGNTYTPASYGNGVLMEVAGWGTTTVHSDGWRCAFAYPKRIIVHNAAQKKLLVDYGVPVELRQDVEDVDLTEVSPHDKAKQDALTILKVGSTIVVVMASVESAIVVRYGGLFPWIAAVLVWIIFAILLAFMIIIDQTK